MKYNKSDLEAIVIAAVANNTEFNYRGKLVQTIGRFKNDLEVVDASGENWSGYVNLREMNLQYADRVLNALPDDIRTQISETARKRRQRSYDRSLRDKVARDMGLTPVRGCVSGRRYYE